MRNDKFTFNYEVYHWRQVSYTSPLLFLLSKCHQFKLFVTVDPLVPVVVVTFQFNCLSCMGTTLPYCYREMKIPQRGVLYIGVRLVLFFFSSVYDQLPVRCFVDRSPEVLTVVLFLSDSLHSVSVPRIPLYWWFTLHHRTYIKTSSFYYNSIFDSIRRISYKKSITIT